MILHAPGSSKPVMTIFLLRRERLKLLGASQAFFFFFLLCCSHSQLQHQLSFFHFKLPYISGIHCLSDAISPPSVNLLGSAHTMHQATSSLDEQLVRRGKQHSVAAAHISVYSNRKKSYLREGFCRAKNHNYSNLYVRMDETIKRQQR